MHIKILKFFFFFVFVFTFIERANATVKVEVFKTYEDFVFTEIESLGTAYAKESVDISPNVSEVIEDIYFSDSDLVNKGDVLVVFAHAEELAQLEAERLQFMEHRREFKRLEKLYKKNAVTRQLLDERRTMLGISEQRIREIETKIDDHIITAPFSGILGFRDISVGDYMEPGDLITTIDDVSEIKIDFSLPSLYLRFIDENTEISVATEVFPKLRFNGKVSFINPRLDPNTRSVEVRAIINNPNYILKPGLLLNVNASLAGRSAILVAEEALLHNDKEHFVYVVNLENKVIKKKVIISERKDGMVQIVKGLLKDELVVIRGLDKIKNSDIVEISKIKEVSSLPYNNQNIALNADF